MQYLSRRPSGVYVFRLAVPSHLRHVFGKREVVVTTGTKELSIAKMVAGSLAVRAKNCSVLDLPGILSPQQALT